MGGGRRRPEFSSYQGFFLPHPEVPSLAACAVSAVLRKEKEVRGVLSAGLSLPFTLSSEDQPQGDHRLQESHAQGWTAGRRAVLCLTRRRGTCTSTETH